MANPALSALITKRAELAGELDALVARAAQARANLIHLDAVIRFLDPEALPEEIPPNSALTKPGFSCGAPAQG